MARWEDRLEKFARHGPVAMEMSHWTGGGRVSKSHYPGPQDLAAVLPRLAVVGGFGRRRLTVWGPTARL